MKTKRIQALEARRDAIAQELAGLDEAVLERGSDLTDDERTTYDALEVELGEVVPELARHVERERLIEESHALTANLKPGGGQGGGGQGGGGARVVEDEPIYRADYSGEFDPLVDVIRAQLEADDGARERIRRHNAWMISTGKAEILRASDRTDFGGLIIPEYALAEYAEAAREGRPFANSLVSGRLIQSPVIIPRSNVSAVAGTPVASGPAYGENSPYPSADVSTTPLTLTARTVSGLAEVSVEAVEFGSLDTPFLFKDLISAYHTELDYQLFHGGGAAVTQHVGLFDSASTVLTLSGAAVDSFRAHYAAVLQAAAVIRMTDKRRSTHVVMSSARWFALQSACDTEGRPLMAMANTMPSNVGGGGSGMSGDESNQIFAGHRVVVDDNIVEDEGDDTNMVVYRAPELVLREQNRGEPTTIRVDQAKAAQGTIQFIARGFSIFSAERRPNSVVVIEEMPEPVFPLPPGSPDVES